MHAVGGSCLVARYGDWLEAYGDWLEWLRDGDVGWKGRGKGEGALLVWAGVRDGRGVRGIGRVWGCLDEEQAWLKGVNKVGVMQLDWVSWLGCSLRMIGEVFR